MGLHHWWIREDGIYLDFCKAFDTVLHDILVCKLERHITDRQTTWWIRNWMDGCTIRVAIKNSKSKWKAVTSIPQGTVSGLVLFNISVSDTDSWEHPQQVWQCYQAVWCGGPTREKECHPEGPRTDPRDGPVQTSGNSKRPTEDHLGPFPTQRNQMTSSWFLWVLEAVQGTH